VHCGLYTVSIALLRISEAIRCLSSLGSGQVDVVLERSPYAGLVSPFAVDLGSSELDESK
jgi:hypothetical protein